MTINQWDTSLYQSKHHFVWQYGESLIELLAPQADEYILDLGCGTGQLTDKIANTGANVRGIDASASMIEQAQRNYPYLTFEVKDARDFEIDPRLDAVFSNAVLHWIKEADSVIKCVSNSLKTGGRFVAEFGGKGNIQAINRSLFNVLESMGYGDYQAKNPCHFPSIGEYTTKLENQGLDVTYAVLFSRPTPLEGGKDGLANWLKMFTNWVLMELSSTEQKEVINRVETQLQPLLYQGDQWFADYRRIRIIAYKN